jgi:heat shock protein HtpX
MAVAKDRIHVLTFPELQAKRRKNSLLIFSILSVYYIFSIIFLAGISKLIFALSLPLLSRGSVWLTPKQVFITALFSVVLAAIHWLFTIPGALSRVESALRAQPPDEQDRYHRVYKNIVEEMIISSGVRNVRPVILPSLSVNAFAAGDMRGNSIIGVTEGLLARLDRAQLQGVVAHEMAHIAEGDQIINTILCSLFAVYAQLMEVSISMAQNGGGVGARGHGRYSSAPFALIVLMVALWIVRRGGLLLKMAVSRQREHLADATAVQLTRNPLGLAEALYKISRSWKGSGFVSEDLEPLFLVNPEEKWLDEKEGFIADLFSTHPPIRKRIFSLVNQARIPLSVLRKKIEEQKEKREEAKEIDKIPKWMVCRDGNWEGPFGVGELTMLKWFTPAVWISLEGKEDILKASEEPLLSNLFQNQLPSSLPHSKFSKEGQTHRCPRCHQALIVSDYEGVYVLRCTFCRGTLVRNDRLPRILAREEKGFSPEQQKWANHWESKARIRPKIPGPDVDPHLHCPKCQKKMFRKFFSYAYFIVIDQCYRCKWTWFDSEELMLLQMLIEKRRSSNIQSS